jgi:hypothetical protein
VFPFCFGAKRTGAPRRALFARLALRWPGCSTWVLHVQIQPRHFMVSPGAASWTGRLHASLSIGLVEKLTNVVEITLAATLFVPQPHRFPETLQAEDKL